jgi:hypothetical protein
MKNKWDDEVPITPEEQDLLDAVKALFSSKGRSMIGAEFRVSFVAEAMNGYCNVCGICKPGPCYCTQND